jgi:hypothetical protein
MRTFPQPDRASHIASAVLSHPLAQDFSYRATSALIDISRGSTSIAPEDADRLACMALQAVVTDIDRARAIASDGVLAAPAEAGLVRGTGDR